MRSGAGPAKDVAADTRSLLLIDDDTELCDLMTEILTAQKLSLTVANDGATGLAAARDGNFDLVILDVMLPRIDGFDVLRRLRESSEVPVIMLTARTASADRISGLELGADDYLPKPFDPRELYARICAILRRSRPARPDGGILTVPPVKIDIEQRRVWNGSAEVDLTTVEFDILAVLLRSAGRIVQRAELVRKLYGRQLSGFDRSIDVHICHLRQKLDSEVPLIRTIRGSGYQFCTRRPESEGE
ncbi:MAG: response regulator transcription factor [Bryobacteraceae bacterium]